MTGQCPRKPIRRVWPVNAEIRFALSGLPVVKIGINFDAQTHTLADWQIEA